jgi:hypothetical protein
MTLLAPRVQAEIEAVAAELERFGLRRNAKRLRDLLGEPPDDDRPCPVQSRDGVRAIPWGLAEILYPAYGHDQSLERMAERGGFGRMELGALAVDGYAALGGGGDRGQRKLGRWPLLDLYDMAKRNG